MGRDKKERYKKVIIICIVIVCGAIITHPRDLRPKEPYLKIYQGFTNLVAKQENDRIEYFLAWDPYTIYNYLTSREMEQAESVQFGRWRYKIILTSTSTGNEAVRYLIPNQGEKSVIEVYKDHLEIDGVFYHFPEGEDVMGWFDDYYDRYADDFGRYVVHLTDSGT